MATSQKTPAGVSEEVMEGFRESIPKNHNFLGEKPEEGTDWVVVPGVSVPHVLHVVSAHPDGGALLHVQDVSSGNCSSYQVQNDEEMARYKHLPPRLKTRAGRYFGS